ncbi:putative SCP-like extracellular domain-containing protein [Neospora caninum Liverpool]|uniref:Putative SCP-like extracellular domain-containing protein n=1 Tax=Neospora caninum (strain Liverpool) TaxID=572307 RepID=F0VRL5_NEOCL|nr:putative SCP-like extracellular domain-containing protein [Neospora caninum Liverpool]CBZ56363.1 putative SCP-like extracellular domain-containing protein [Neospora caninum Liverpool]CEL71123.1 TPA: SCP-like extracellular domain-containing protein,putative [Neospora caninum Liverpool]|eukprot:XP_003886388.1 putative SCP-like extracellular domain-containing protein [Neospora caninum Liverpool]
MIVCQSGTDHLLKMLASKASFEIGMIMRCLIVASVTGLLSGIHTAVATAIASELVFEGVELMATVSDAAFHREKILDRHNYLRSREAENGFGSGAVFMNRLVYDVGMEAPLRVARGENLYTNSVDYSRTPSGNFDSAQIVQKWWDERQYFDWHAENPSQSAQRQGKMVGHWTQVVRAEASTVGCWIVTGCQCKAGKSCQKANNGRWATYMACHYDYGNLGHYPYWPLNANIQYRMPSTVAPNRRQRCGSCPKGFNQCGTTIGGGEKRDAYLCAGYWNINEAMPPADLLRKSISTRHSSSGIPSWYFMVRNCARGNGSCPSNSSCWTYENGKALVAEPPVLVNQCQCNGFSTQYGIYFERDMCGQYSAIQPYYDADAFLAFAEIGGLNTSSATLVGNAPSSTRRSDKVLEKRRLSTHLHTAGGYLDARSSLAELGKHDDIGELDQTLPLAETPEEASDLVLHLDKGSQRVSVQQPSAAGDSVRKQKQRLFSPTAADGLVDDLTFLSLQAVRHVIPPSDDLMFEWRNVRDPQLIARRPAAARDAVGSALQVVPTLRGISQHHREPVSTRLSTAHEREPLGFEMGNNEKSLEDYSTGRSVETPSLQRVELNASTATNSVVNGEKQINVSPTSPEANAEEGPPLAEVVDDEETSLRGAPVNMKAVQNEAREKNKFPLPSADEAGSDYTRKPRPSDEQREPSERPMKP